MALLSTIRSAHLGPSPQPHKLPRGSLGDYLLVAGAPQ